MRKVKLNSQKKGNRLVKPELVSKIVHHEIYLRDYWLKYLTSDFINLRSFQDPFTQDIYSAKEVQVAIENLHKLDYDNCYSVIISIWKNKQILEELKDSYRWDKIFIEKKLLTKVFLLLLLQLKLNRLGV